jgi:hypothetical protein
MDTFTPQNNIDSGAEPYHLLPIKLDRVRQHLDLCVSHINANGGMTENEQVVTISHLLGQVEELIPLCSDALAAAAKDGKL